ncbi:MAG: ADP-forming succinate--CoA ligase subunit beta [Candidatus Eremiobacter antarcticus]|nr:ADP-forming succinate--CoA ligase subunit beta [Candidatus Eremiobacteraeota bacterium]PZR60807.1 MAG: ADP-forming succinate--CoA ligase subunit beta [Candidatus Eremiobacter sp. RRmetagenome_bin22]
MRLLEYQGKELFAKAGIPVPPGRVAHSVDEAVAIMRANPAPSVVKAQVLIGGRGKAGGIKFCSDADDVVAPARAILGMDIKGEIARSVLIEQRMDIKKELYLSITVDRASKKPVIIASAMGGMDIEEVASREPSAIAKRPIDTAAGYWPFVGRRIGREAGIPIEALAQFAAILGKLYALFFEVGAMLLEINPLAITGDGKLVASDAKVDLDDNALFKHPEFTQWKTDAESDALKARAIKAGLGENNYVALDGDVGIIGNGAGLVMGTLDAVKSAGGEAANFLDIGGGAKAEIMREAVNIVTSNPNVKALFINIFGGITRGDEVARGLITALDGGKWSKDKLVIRLTGTNEREARDILESNGIVAVDTMNEGAKRAVALAKT